MRLRLLEVFPLVFDEPFGRPPHRQVHVRAASAVVRLGGAWVLAQDDSNFAAVRDARGTRPLRLFPDAHGDTYSPALGNKQFKPDLECGAGLTLEGREAAVFFGSGSTPARRRAAVVFGPPERAEVRAVDAGALYEAAERALGLSAGELNLEGACRVGGALRFFQRGNAGPRGRNATFDVALAAVEALLAGREGGGARVEVERVRDYALGSLGGARLGFSAADALPGGAVLFAASAEDSPNTYDDGACAGSALGRISPGGELGAVVPLPPEAPASAKVEGLALESWGPAGGTVLAVTDADDPEKPALALRLEVGL